MTILTIQYTLDATVQKIMSYDFPNLYEAKSYLKEHEDWEGGAWDERHITFNKH